MFVKPGGQANEFVVQEVSIFGKMITSEKSSRVMFSDTFAVKLQRSGCGQTRRKET